MQNNKSREMIRIIGGMLFTFLIIVAFYMMAVGTSKLIMFVNTRLPSICSVPLMVIILLFIVVITVISKANIGGDALKISIRELLKKKEKAGRGDHKK